MGGDSKGTSGSLLWGALLVIPAALARFFHQAPPHPRPEPPSLESPAPPAPAPAPHESASGGDALTWCRARFLAPIQTYATADPIPIWDQSPEAFASSRPPGATYGGARDAAMKALVPSASLPVKVLVATVPDPVDSGYRYYFDGVLGSLQLGVEAEGYLRDQWWLPWDDPQLSDRKLQSVSEGCRREVPGVLVFRRTATPGVLLLLLVGETPTFGVQKAALAEALDFADRYDTTIDATDPAAPPGGYAIVGPSFSGSAESLARVLAAAAPHRTRIRTGSATSPSVVEVLRRALPGRDPPRVDFGRTAIREDELQCAFYRFLAYQHLAVGREHRRMLEHVAILRESGTAFGAHTAGEGTDPGACPFEPEVDMEFPLHISSLREAYEAEDARNVAPRADIPVRSTSLEVPLEATHPRDGESPRSLVTTAAQDVALSHLLSEVSREGIRFVGIQATDSADAIFLARKVRDVAPDVRFVFFQSDALFLHAEYHADLVGSYIVTPYPFFGSNDFGTTPGAGHHHRAFLGSTAEGVFNATLSVLDRDTSKLSEYAFFVNDDPRIPTRLPAWIAAIGSGGATPVAVRTTSETCKVGVLEEGCGLDEHRVETPRDAWMRMRTMQLHVDGEVTPPTLWEFAYVVLMAAASAHWLRRRRVRAFLRGWRTIAPVRPIRHLPTRRRMCRTQYALYDFARGVVVAIALAYMLVIQRLTLATFRPKTQHQFPLLVMWAGVVTLAIALLAVGRRWRRLTEGRRSLAILAIGGRSRGPLRIAVSSYVVAGVAAAIVVAMGVELSRAGVAFTQLNPLYAGGLPVHGALLILRTLPLLSGLSPAVPILATLASMYVWASGRMARLLALDRIAATCPSEAEHYGVATPLSYVLQGANEASFRSAGLAEAEARLVVALQQPAAVRIYPVAVAGLALFPLFVLVLKPPSSLEDYVGTLTLFGLIALATLCIGSTLVQLALYWTELRKMLRRIASLPVCASIRPIAAAVPTGHEGPPDDLTRVAACVAGFEALLGDRSKGAIDFAAIGLNREDLEAHLGQMRSALCASLAARERTNANATARGERAARLVLASAMRLGGAIAIACVPARGEARGIREARAYVATVVALLVERYARQFQIFIVTLTAMALLLLVAISGYVFEPRRLLLTCMWGIMLSVVGAGFYVYVQLERNGLLSRIAGTEPGKVDVDAAFVARVVAWGLLPLLTVAAAQYPEIARALFAWAAPFAKALS